MKHDLVIILGDANVDLVIHLPDRGGGALDMTGSVPQLHGGGSAANVAVAVARLDQDVLFVGSIGNDGYGQWVSDDLASEGVEVTDLYRLDDKFTPMVIALIEPSGERMVVVWPPKDGAHHWLPSEAIHPTFFQKAGWLHTSGMCLRKSPVRETILMAMEEAKALELRFNESIEALVKIEDEAAFRTALDKAVKQKEDVCQLYQRANMADKIAWNLGRQIKTKTDGMIQYEPEKDFYFSGAKNVIANPEFGSPEQVGRILELLDRKDVLLRVLSEHSSNEVSIVIGEESAEELTKNCSIITTTYSIDGAVGTLGVIGPTRMQYAKIISLVKFMSDTLNYLVSHSN